MEFPEKLKKLRTDAKLSQKSLAEKIDVSQAAVGYWEKGERTPSIEACQKLADYFHVSPSYLMGWDEEYDELEKKIDYILSELSSKELSQEEVSNFVRQIKIYLSEQSKIEDKQYNISIAYKQKELTPEEEEKVEEYIEFLKSKRP